MLAMRYGTVPVVRETGGLKDTVLSYNEVTGEGNGFSFLNYNAHDMLHVLQRALHFYWNKKDIWQLMQRRGMTHDFSWETSSRHYLSLYESLVHPAAPPPRPPEPKAPEIKKATPQAKAAPRKKASPASKPAAKAAAPKTVAKAPAEKPAPAPAKAAGKPAAKAPAKAVPAKKTAAKVSPAKKPAPRAAKANKDPAAE